jgi:hypothetical protein
MVGKARLGMPTVQFETGQLLVKRFKAVQEAKEEFWDRWVKEIFPIFFFFNKPDVSA